MRKAQVLIVIAAILAITLILFSISMREVMITHQIVGQDPNIEYVQLFYFLEQSAANGTQNGFAYLLSNYNKSNFDPKLNVIAASLAKSATASYYKYTLNNIASIGGFKTDIYENSSNNPILVSINVSLIKAKGSFFNLSLTKIGILKIIYHIAVNESRIVISNSSTSNYYLVTIVYDYRVYFANKEINILDQFSPLVNGSEKGNFVYLVGKNYFEFILPAGSENKTIIGLKDSFGIIGWVLV